MKKLCPSVLSADFSKLGAEIKEVESAGADIIHCDIMDGHFVPNITFGASVVNDINNNTDLPLDVHLMIEHPEKYIKDFVKAGADYISVHYENNIHLHRLISEIKDSGVKAGVVLNPATPVFLLKEILEYLDYVLIMSVNPGFGGQSFIPSSINKIKDLKELLEIYNKNCLIEIDGGIDLKNIKEVSDAGADLFVCGATIFRNKNRIEIIKQLKEIIS